jgi:glycosyltransferase involved in cell wall biosynthesis
VAVLAVRAPSGEVGGAERFFAGLVGALNDLGARADRIELDSDESSFEAIEESYLRFHDHDLSAYDGVISTKAPSYAVRHPNHVCYLVHTMRVFYDMFEREFPAAPAGLRAQRAQIHRLDTAALAPRRVRKVFAIGEEVRARLVTYNRLDATVLHPPPHLEGLRPGRQEYAFLPGRLHRWKRVDLVIEALRLVDRPLRLLISGTGEDEAALRRAAGGDPRVSFLGRVSDARLVELYADALVVPFVPVREDLGLVTLEAFRACKPVLTCTDSGEPNAFVKDGETGFSCAPVASELASRLTWLFDHPDQAAAMGNRGQVSIAHIRWDAVGTALLRALFPGAYA